MNAIKYSLLAVVGFYFVYDEIRAGLDYWLPAVGYAADHGYMWAPFAFLAVVGAGFSRVSWFSFTKDYRFCSISWKGSDTGFFTNRALDFRNSRPKA